MNESDLRFEVRDWNTIEIFRLDVGDGFWIRDRARIALGDPNGKDFRYAEFISETPGAMVRVENRGTGLFVDGKAVEL